MCSITAPRCASPVYLDLLIDQHYALPLHFWLGELIINQLNGLSRPCGASKSCFGPIEMIPVGLMVLWLR